MRVSTTAPLSDEEHRLFLALLRRFGEADLDQYEHWRFGTRFGEVFVTIARAPAPGATPDAYIDLTPFMTDD